MLARARAEALYGTAPCSDVWLLLEQPGPWGTDALLGSGLPPAVSGYLTRNAEKQRFRALLIRRAAGRHVLGERSCFLVRCHPSGTWMERLLLEDPLQLLDLDLAALQSPTAPGLGTPVKELYAVCTHGRRDPCCAEHGRRLAAHLRAPQPDGEGLAGHVWESSHQGGHRFAPNLICFPHGLFYGNVEPEHSTEVVRASRSGRLHLDHLRGRSAFQPVVQAAEHFIRESTRLDRIDDLALEGTSKLRTNEYEISFASPQGTHTARIRLKEGQLRPESCNKTRLTPVRVFDLLSLDTAGAITCSAPAGQPAAASPGWSNRNGPQAPSAQG